MPQYNGVLEGFFETGTEGMVWSLIQDGKEGYDALIYIEEGDRLKVFREDQTVLCFCVIKKNREIGWTEYPLNPGHGQPSALGMWIHWTQDGWMPDDWAKMFFQNPPLRAELVRLDS